MEVRCPRKTTPETADKSAAKEEEPTSSSFPITFDLATLCCRQDKLI
jgi:hypothetical protein